MPKRSNGEGSIYHDPARDRYIGAVSIGTKRRRVYGKTKTEARDKLKALIRQMDDAGTVADGNARVSDAVAKWRDRVLPSKGYAPATALVVNYTLDLIDAHLGTKRLRTLSIDDVEAGLDAMTSDRNGKPISKATAIKVRSTLGQVLDMAQRRGMVAGNVARGAVIGTKATPSTERTFLNVDEARTLLGAIDAERYGALFAVMVTTGLRPGEAAGILWENVDLDAGTIHVRTQVATIDRKASIVDELKTARSRRTVAIPPAIVDMMRRHRTTQATERLAASRWDDPRLVFATRNGTPLSASNVRRELSRITKAAGLPDVTPNELRHTAASIMSDAGLPLEDIADTLGHVNTRMLQATYRHQLRSHVAASADIMHTALG